MDSKTTPPHWKRPEDVMRMHKLRVRKRALQFRFTDQENKSSSTSTPQSSEIEKKFASRNPFKYVCTLKILFSFHIALIYLVFQLHIRRAKVEPDVKFNADLNDDTTTDGTLFRLLNFSQQSNNGGDESANTSFANAFAALNNPSSSQKVNDIDYK